MSKQEITAMKISELPCEYASREIIPSIRAALVKYLVEERGFTKYTVAKMLGITPASVTYYLKGARGNRRLEEKLLSEPYISFIKRLADIVVEAYNSGITRERYTAYRNVVCTLCSGFNPIVQASGCAHHPH